MSEQLEFLNLPPSKPANNRLFLAIFPDSDSARSIHELAGGIRDRHRLSARIRPLGHLHITLRWFDDHIEIPESLVRDVSSACETVTARLTPFKVTFDHVRSWGTGMGKHPLVLLGHNNTELLALHRVLLQELIKCRCPGKGGQDFNPHITLLYDQQSIEEESASPVSWTVNEIVLIHSEVGATKYHERGRWKFCG